nr:MAG TPA: hypothetical protein [Caudoviricetes sp.]
MPIHLWLMALLAASVVKYADGVNILISFLYDQAGL